MIPGGAGGEGKRFKVQEIRIPMDVRIIIILLNECDIQRSQICGDRSKMQGNRKVLRCFTMG